VPGVSSEHPPRPEYPRPQYRRERWLNLNGQWEFADTAAPADAPAGWLGRALPDSIVVPFCRKSRLSGLARTDHVPEVWYARTITVPADWSGQRVLLHFGAADYITTVWVDGTRVGTHRAGHSSFSFEITEVVRADESHRLTVRCEDDPKLPRPCGKQRSHPANSGCHYVQTTGIWQTVWLEPVPMTWLGRPRITPNMDAGGFWVEQRIHHLASNHRLTATLSAHGKVVSEASVEVARDFCASLWLPLAPADRHPWAPGARHGLSMPTPPAVVAAEKHGVMARAPAPKPNTSSALPACVTRCSKTRAVSATASPS